ncbi:MAG: hypothetical protein HKN20_09355 [Gemmatimonadetes bacterium]|nr:hypothetical protein [Gemmatimonadota bacterium]
MKTQRWSIQRSLVISITLHFVLPLLLIRCDAVTSWLDPEPVEAARQHEPLVFEFVEPTPGPAPETPPETNRISTADRLARSPEKALDPSSRNPASKGNSPVLENKIAAEKTPPPEPQRQPAEEQVARTETPASDAGLRKAPPVNETTGAPLNPARVRQEIERSVRDQRYDNPRGSAPLPGSLSFETAESEFGPYLLMLKRKIEEKWYPPEAAFHGSKYRGASVVRFSIRQDGTLAFAELLSGADHPSLDTAARNAVLYAGPFPRLPLEFPKETWEITCTFFYR